MASLEGGADPPGLPGLPEEAPRIEIQYVGSVRMLRANFLALVSTLYGEDKADELERGMLLAAE